MNHINKDTEIKSNLHDKATYVPENSSKPNNGNLRNSDEVLFQSNEAPIFTTDVVPRTGLNDFSLMYPSNKVLKLYQLINLVPMKIHYCILLIVNRQVSNNAGTPGTIRRKMKGHVRNKSSKGGGSGGWGNLANGSFKPGHRRNQSVLSKISKLSILTFGNLFMILFNTLLDSY